MSREDEHEEPELPWTEQQWEAFMKQADLRAARYSELLETLMDDPDRERIIDREMGWDRKTDDTDREWMKELEDAAADAMHDDQLRTEFEEDEQEEGEGDDAEEGHPRKRRKSFEEEMEEDDRKLRAIPAYHVAMEISQRLDVALKPLMPDDKEADEDVVQAFIQIKIVSAKIAGGHGMGYEDEVIGGNVVNCKRALEAAIECRHSLVSLRERRLLEPAAADAFLADVTRLEGIVQARIDELRSKMWWQK